MYPSNKQIALYINRMGEHGKKTLSLLGKKQEFITALNSSIGKELLDELITMHESLLHQVATFTATDEQKAEYRVIGRILGVWATKVADYENKCKSIIKEAEKDGKDGS